jgi:L-arabinokinase
VPSAFVLGAVRTAIELQPLETDTGVVQIDSLALDEDETTRRAGRFYANFDARVATEAAALRELAPSIVVGDIPPLAFAAAASAQVPSVAIGNFTWDWIYGAYEEMDRTAPHVLPTIRRAYAAADRALRLPLHGGFEPMRDVLRDIPLIARRSQHGREAVRSRLGIDQRATVVLASFGAYGAHVPYAQVVDQGTFTLVVTDHESPDRSRVHDHERFRWVPAATLAANGLTYPSLVAAADVVVSKPGYGIVSECIANGASLLYTDRGRFREHDVFVREMPQVLKCRYISPEDLKAGRWSDAIAALLLQPDPPTHMATNGAEVAAQEIIGRARGPREL